MPGVLETAVGGRHPGCQEGPGAEGGLSVGPRQTRGSGAVGSRRGTRSSFPGFQLAL